MHMIHHHNSLNHEMHRCEHFYFTEFHKSLDDREKRKRGYVFVIKISNNFVITCHGYDSIWKGKRRSYSCKNICLDGKLQEQGRLMHGLMLDLHLIHVFCLLLIYTSFFLDD